jgi:hypothetical protein
MGYARVSTKIRDSGSDAKRLTGKDQAMSKATYPIEALARHPVDQATN